MRESAMDTHAARDGCSRQAVTDSKRFGPLCRLGYTISGQDGAGFTATDPATGQKIRRLTFAAFTKAVRQVGLTRAARSELLVKRATPEHRLREQVETQRLQLIAMERREVCPTKRTPKTKTRTAAPARRRQRLNNSRNFPA